MKDLNSREEMTEKEEPTLLSTEEVEHPCKCTKRDKRDPRMEKTPHRKEVFSDGWTRWECLKPGCGQIKFTRGRTVNEEKVNA